MKKISDQISKLIDLKSILTLMMTWALIKMLLGDIEVNQAILALFSTAYGSMITFFFTKKSSKESEPDGDKQISNTNEL